MLITAYSCKPKHFKHISIVLNKWEKFLRMRKFSVKVCNNVPGYSGSHEIMVLFIRKLFLLTPMHSHPVGLDVWFLVRPFIYFHTSCVRPAKAMAKLHKCAGSSEPSMVTYVISTIISWAGSSYICKNSLLHKEWTYYSGNQRPEKLSFPSKKKAR